MKVVFKLPSAAYLMQRYKKERAFTRFPRYLTVFRGKTGKKSRVTGKKQGKIRNKVKRRLFFQKYLYLCNTLDSILCYKNFKHFVNYGKL